jgi:hypothetical protein
MLKQSISAEVVELSTPSFPGAAHETTRIDLSRGFRRCMRYL